MPFNNTAKLNVYWLVILCVIRLVISSGFLYLYIVINIKITDNYDIKTFEEQLNNKIIGFYEVVVEDILNHVNVFEKLGI